MRASYLKAAQEELTDRGRLQVTALSEQNIPIENAAVSISYTGDPTGILEEVRTDASGRTQEVELDAPPVEYSLTPSEEQPYAEYTLRISAAGFETLTITGSEILSSQLSLQKVRLRALRPEELPEVVTIPEHTLYGNYPPKIAEDEIKPVNISGEIVLDQVVIPEFIVVHDGTPRDTTASNYYVRYKDYIKSVACSEIYATWPYATLIANILAIQSFTLNRVYTEWYRDHSVFVVEKTCYCTAAGLLQFFVSAMTAQMEA